MRSAVTVCQVPQASAGPFVLHDPLPEAFAKAAAYGFEAVELFFPSADFVSVARIRELMEKHRIGIAAVGTGAGMVREKLSLTDASQARREEALEFVLRFIAFAGQLGAPAILGSMQGGWSDAVSRENALDYLARALRRCGEEAGRFEVPFLYEPLNRYETNLINRLEDARRFLEENGLGNVLLLADLFHMNIEEVSLPGALREAGPTIGHVHFADSNRRAMGLGHTDPIPVMEALADIGYKGYLSAEIFPLPDSDTACRRTIDQIHRLNITK